MPLDLNRQSAVEQQAKEKKLDAKETKKVEETFVNALKELTKGEKANSPLKSIVDNIIDEPDQTFANAKEFLAKLEAALKTATPAQKEKIVWLYGYLTEVDELETVHTSEIKEVISSTRDIIAKTTSEIAKVLKPKTNDKEQTILSKISSLFSLTRTQEEAKPEEQIDILKNSIQKQKEGSVPTQPVVDKQPTGQGDVVGGNANAGNDLLKNSIAKQEKGQDGINPSVTVDGVVEKTPTQNGNNNNLLQNSIEQQKITGFANAKVLDEVVVIGKKKPTVVDIPAPTITLPVKAPDINNIIPTQKSLEASPQKTTKKQPEKYENQEESSHIQYQLKGHEFTLSGQRFDITTDKGLREALALVASGGDVAKAEDMKKDFKNISVKDLDAIMSVALQNWPTGEKGFNRRTIKKVAKSVDYDRKGNFLFLDFKNDFKALRDIFNALGKTGVEALYAVRNTRVDVQEIANTVLDKKNNDLGKITADNVFDYLADRDGDGKISGEQTKEKISEQSFVDSLLDVGNRKYTPALDNNGNVILDKVTNKLIEKKILVDGPRTAKIIEATIGFIDGRGNLNGASKKQLEAGDAIKTPEVGYYNLANFARLIKENPIYKVYYNNSLADWVANKKVDLHDVVRSDLLTKKLFEKSEVEGSQDFSFDGKINTINSDQKKWFEDHINKLDNNSDVKKWFLSLQTEGQKSFMYALTKTFQKTSLLTSTLGFKTEKGEPINESNLMDAMNVDFKWLKDEGGKGVRIVPMFRFKNEYVYSRTTGELIKKVKLPTDFFIGFNLPIVTAGVEKRVNRNKLDKVAEDQFKSLNSVYAHLGAHVAAYINVGFDKKNLDYAHEFKDFLNIFEPQFGALAQADLGFEKDYNAGTEYISNRFAERLGVLFSTNGATTLEGVKTAFKANLETAKKQFKGYDKMNPGRLEEYQNLMLAILEASPVFAYIKAHPEAAKNLDAVIKGLSKGLVAENEKEKMQGANGDTKFTKIGIFGRAGLMFDLKKLGDPNGFKDMIKDNAKLFGAGLNIGFTSFLVKYAPDQEKYEYMDESLKKGLDMNRIEGVELSEGVDKIAQNLEKSMNVDGLKITTDQGRLVFSLDPEHPVTTADGKPVTDIATLLNIYVDTQEKNVAFSADGKSLVVGDVTALGYINRNYFNDQSHYLIVGKGGVEGKKWVHGVKDLPQRDVDVNEVKTDIYTDVALKKALLEDPSLEGTLEQKTLLVESIIPAYLHVDQKTHLYMVKQGGQRVEFNHHLQGLNIVCDKAGKCEDIQITNQKGTIYFEQAEYIADSAPRANEILSRDGREVYDAIKNELFTNVDFGPLVSKYKHTDKAIAAKYKALVSGTHEPAELKELLKGVQAKMEADNFKFVAGDKEKVKTSINKVIDKIDGKIDGCTSLDCRLIVNVFMSKLPQSVGHAAKSGEFISGGKMEAIFAEGYSHNGKKLDAIKKMNLPTYLDTHIKRLPAFTRVMKNAGLGAFTSEIISKEKNKEGIRTKLLNSVQNESTWTVRSENSSLNQTKGEGNVLMFNANMTPGVDEFNLIPPGEAMMAYVGKERMVSKIDNKDLEKKMLAMLKKEQYGGYKAALESKYKGITEQQVDDFILGKKVTVGDKTFRHNGLGLVFGFYGGCFNESLGFDIGQIIEDVKVPAIKGSIMLKDIVGMKFNADAQTLTSTPYLDQRKLNRTGGGDASWKNRRTEGSSTGGGGPGGGGGSGGGGPSSGGGGGSGGGTGGGNGGGGGG